MTVTVLTVRIITGTLVLSIFKNEVQDKNTFCLWLLVACCCFLECETEFHKAQWAIIALQSNYFSEDRAKLCGTPGGTRNPRRMRQNSIWDIKDARMIAADRRAGFPDKLTTQKRQSAAVPLGTSAVIGRVLWNLQNSHHWSVSLNSKHSHQMKQEKGMPQRQWGIPLIHLLSPLLGDICTRDGSLDCV